MHRSPRQRPIVAFGDSLVEGVGASKKNDWVSILSARYQIPFLNKGVRNDTTRSAMARLEMDALRHDPSFIILLLGGNDILFRIPKKETFHNLSIMIDQIQEHKTGMLLVGVRGGILGDAFEGRFQTLAEEKGIPFIPNILEDIFGKPHLMTDPLHPNDEGYRIMADQIESILVQVLEPTHNEF